MCLPISYFNFLTEGEAAVFFSCCKHVVIAISSCSACSACSYRQYSFISLPVLKIIAYITCTIDFQY